MWESLKKLIRSNNDRIVVVEDNEPRYVIMPIAEYTALVEKGLALSLSNGRQTLSVNSGQADSSEVLQKVNSALQEAHESEPSLTSLIDVPEKKEISMPVMQEEKLRQGINIEDLPL